MNGTGKTLIAAATAAALAGGAYLAVDNAAPGDIAVPVLEIPAVTVPTVAVPVAVAPVVPVPDTASASVSDLSDLTVSVEVPRIDDPAARIPLLRRFAARVDRVFRDRRNARTLTPDSAAAAKWLDRAEAGTVCKLVHIPLPEGLRMIAEIHHPADPDALARNLDRYAARGCNAALLTFGYEGENIDRLIDAARLCRRKGFAPWFAYAGPERLTHSVWRDPDVLEREVAAMAAVCDGMILGWRRTSAHLYRQDEAFRALLLNAARGANPRLAVLGEAYWGETAEAARGLALNLPPGVSGALVAGLGFHGVAVEAVFARISAAIGGAPQVPLIVGARPYYASRNRDGRSPESYWMDKSALAARWLVAGAAGVVILHGDGSDGMYDPEVNDNLAQTVSAE